MFKRIRTRFGRRHHQRGWAPWMWAGAVAVAGGGAGTVWGLSDWRIEQTSDGLMCGIERDLWQVTGVKLAMAATEAQACTALFSQPRETCPVFAPTAMARCAKSWRTAHAIPGAAAASAPPRAMLTSFDQGTALADTGLPAVLVAQLKVGQRTLMTGGPECPQTQEVAYRLTLSEETPGGKGYCLGVGVAPGVFATAAHCVERMENVAMRCTGSTVTTTALSCVFAKDDEEQRQADLAICTVAPTGTPCMNEVVERHPVWQPPVPTPAALHVMGVGYGCLKLGVISGPITWPPDSDSELVFAHRSGSEPGAFTIDEGDSGGAVFDSADKSTRRVIGVSVQTAEMGQPAQIVPFYRWPKLEPALQ